MEPRTTIALTRIHVIVVELKVQCSYCNDVIVESSFAVESLNT